MPEQVDLVDVILTALQGERDDIHTAMPGKVVAYYPDKQTADIQPMLKRPVFDENGGRLKGASLPVLPSVPVIWPRAGGYILKMPMQPGDFVWLMFSEGGTGEYRTTGQESEPLDVSRHTITYPYCTPGAFPDTSPSSDPDVTANEKMVVGKSGGKAKITFDDGDGVFNFPKTQIGYGDATILVEEADPGALTPARIVMGDGSDAAALASVLDLLIHTIMAWVPAGTVGDASALKSALTTAGFSTSTKSGSNYVKIK